MPKTRAGFPGVVIAVLFTCPAARQVAADGMVFRPIDYKGSLNREQFQQHCDKHKTQKQILENLK